MSVKAPFNFNIKAVNDDKVTYINCDHIVKFEYDGTRTFLRLHLVDGSNYDFDEDTAERIIKVIEQAPVNED